MWAILRTCGQACATPMAAVIPSDDWMLVMRKTYLGLGIALSNRKSVHPSVRIVSSPSSSATGPTAGLVPLDMTPVNMSILASSFIRRTSFTQASVPAASSAVMVSILRLPSSPPCALISSAAMVWPLIDGSPSTAPAPVRNVMWPVLKGVSGMRPLAGSCAALSTCEPPTTPAPMRPAPPMVTPNVLRKARRFTEGVVFSMMVSPSEGRPKADRLLPDPPMLQSYYCSCQVEQPNRRVPGSSCGAWTRTIVKCRDQRTASIQTILSRDAKIGEAFNGALDSL